MIALGIAGSVVGALALLVLAAGFTLALRQRRVDRQTSPPQHRPAPPARRHADLRHHPADEETQEIPTIQGGSPQ